jgi:CrcB protein
VPGRNVTIAAIAVGGALGSVLRYLLSSSTQQWVGRAFPLGTLLVNFIGCFAIGLLCVWLIERAPVSEAWRAFWMVGVLGGFTTFSTFSLDAFELVQDGNAMRAVVYIAASLVLCLGGTVLGVVLARSI